MRKFARIWIEKYSSVAKLNEAIAGPRRIGSEGTVQSYIVGVRHFVKFLGFENPEIALRKLQSGEVDPTTKVDQFIDYDLTRHSHKTVRCFLFGIKKWLELNEVRAKWNIIEFPTSAEVQEIDRAPSKEEIKRLLNHSKGARERATTLILTSSGLRIGTLAGLTVGDVSFNYPNVARIRIKRKRGRKFASKGRRGEGRVYFTFITPEAKEALIQYLKEREVAGEKLTPKSPLIGDAWNHGKFTTVENLQRSWYRLLKRARLAEKSKKWFQLHLHTLRKYFRSNCVGVDPSYREMWMGHKGGYLDESYFRAEEERHLSEYRKAIPHLTVYSTGLEEKQLRAKAMLDFARLQGYADKELKRLEEILARAKDIDEGIREFRRFREQQGSETMHNGNSKYVVVQGEGELLHRLENGWKLVQALNGDKYLLQHP